MPYFVNPMNSSPDNPHSDKPTTVIAGATGYIGRAVVRESVQQGYRTLALVRDMSKIRSEEGKRLYGDAFEGAEVVECDVENRQNIVDTVKQARATEGGDITVISCLASPSGIRKEAYAIDYQATLNCLEAGMELNAKHFVLLSAFCVRNPLLQLQQAKLKFEAALMAQSDLTWSIVRPTAFLKSISGQLEGIQQGAPYVLFGDGALTRCNPISEEDLATFMINCITDESKHNQIMNIGGPDEPLTNQMLGEMMFKAVGKEPKFVYAPTWIFDLAISSIQLIADVTKSEKWEDAVEVGKIGKYYAVEDMLTTDPREKYGTKTVQEHYNKIAAKGQDPFTPVRATAAIARTIELLPKVAISLSVGYLTLAYPQFLERAVAVATKEIPEISLLLANLKL